MNEDYLWNKTGEDPEIEKLENALKTLRSRTDFAPRISAETKLEKKSSFNLFPFLIPSATCLMFALLALGFWLRAEDKLAEIAEDMNQSQGVVQTVNKPEIVQSRAAKEISQTVRYKEKPAAKQRLNKVPKTRPTYVRVNAVTAQENKKENPVDVLTKEEKYAYDQLMTAIAITGSQLKLVKDKIQGVEDQSAVVRSGQ